MLNICGASRNLAIMNPHDFYSYFNKDNAVLYHALNRVMVYYNRKIQRLFIPKFYHERKSKNFLKTLKFIREWDIMDKIGFSEFPNEFSRKLYKSIKKILPMIELLLCKHQMWTGLCQIHTSKVLVQH